MSTRHSRGAGLEINFWPSYTDIGMLMILILILFLFIQIASNTQAFELHTIRMKQLQLEKALQQAINDAHVEGITIRTSIKSQKITFSGNILFDSAKADLKEDGKRILKIVGDVLRSNAGVYESIRIEGHTDNVPLKGGRFDNNWDLSSTRATEVVKFLNEDLKLQPVGGKLYAAGYSEYSPAAENLSDYGKSLNRRIELIIDYEERKK